jgi:formylglycine-generating enzyme required for sulfatase activity
MKPRFTRFFRTFTLSLSIYLSTSSLCWANHSLKGLPPEVLSQSLFSLSVKELDQAARSYSFIRKVVFSEYFYKSSKETWLANKQYQNLVDFPQYWVLRQIKAKFHDLEWRKKAVHMLLDTESQFAEIPAGTFQMGSPNTDRGRDDDEDLHWVHISSPYRLQRVPFTQLLLVLVTGRNNSYSKMQRNCPEDHLELQIEERKVSLCPRNPVDRMAWNDITKKDASVQAAHDTVIGILREQFGINTRLPTEAEWERAARGLSENYQPYSFGENSEDNSGLMTHAWYGLNSGTQVQHADSNKKIPQDRPKMQTHRVATKLPTAFGLFDMHGNVYEWMEDMHEDYTPAPDKNQPLISPVGTASTIGDVRIIRGGSYLCLASTLRSAHREVQGAWIGDSQTGFRLIRTQ